MTVEVFNDMLMLSRIKNSSPQSPSAQLVSHSAIGRVDGASDYGANSVCDQDQAWDLTATTGSGSSTYLSQRRRTETRTTSCKALLF